MAEQVIKLGYLPIELSSRLRRVLNVNGWNCARIDFEETGRVHVGCGKAGKHLEWTSRMKEISR